MIKKFEVTFEDSAKLQGSGDLLVLSTPRLIAYMENTAKLMLEKSSVGYKMNIKHIAPTPIGAIITIDAKLIKQDNRFYDFEIEAYDSLECIAKATHTRVIIDSEKFQKKVDEKNNRMES